MDGGLADAVFGVNIVEGEADRFRSTIFLTLRNTDSDTINASVNDMIRGMVVKYKGVDTVDDESNHAMFRVKFLKRVACDQYAPSHAEAACRFHCHPPPQSEP